MSTRFYMSKKSLYSHDGNKLCYGKSKWGGGFLTTGETNACSTLKILVNGDNNFNLKQNKRSATLQQYYNGFFEDGKVPDNLSKYKNTKANLILLGGEMGFIDVRGKSDIIIILPGYLVKKVKSIINSNNKKYLEKLNSVKKRMEVATAPINPVVRTLASLARP